MVPFQLLIAPPQICFRTSQSGADPLTIDGRLYITVEGFTVQILGTSDWFCHCILQCVWPVVDIVALF